MSSAFYHAPRPFTVLRNRFFGFDELVSASTNCTGNAFLRVTTDPLAVPILPKATVAAPGSTIYIEDPNAVAQTILAKL